LGRLRDKQGVLAFLAGAAVGGAYGHLKAGMPGAIFGALAGGGVGIGLVWWMPIGMALVVILIAFIFLFMVYGAFWSNWLR
jgi:hypothetical protein